MTDIHLLAQEKLPSIVFCLTVTPCGHMRAITGRRLFDSFVYIHAAQTIDDGDLQPRILLFRPPPWETPILQQGRRRGPWDMSGWRRSSNSMFWGASIEQPVTAVRERAVTREFSQGACLDLCHKLFKTFAIALIPEKSPTTRTLY